MSELLDVLEELLGGLGVMLGELREIFKELGESLDELLGELGELYILRWRVIQYVANSLIPVKELSPSYTPWAHVSMAG